MKNYRKRSMKFIILLAILFLGINVVHASNYNGVIYEGEEIDGIYFYKHRSDTADTIYETHHFHEPARFFRRSSDGAYVYCIQSWNALTGAQNGDYQESSSYTSRLTKEQIEMITLLGYYGYGYKEKEIDHTDPKWYAITQYLIWQIEAPSIEHYFVSSLTSKTPIYPFNNEIKELEELVKKHRIYPDFNRKKVDMIKGESLSFQDTNEVFNTYTFRATPGITTSRRGNTLSIFANRVGKHTITIEKTTKRFTHNAIYYISDQYQDAILIGNFTPSKMTIDVSVIGGSARVTKTGEKLVGFDDGRFTYEDELASNVTLELYAAKDIVNNTNYLFYHKDEKVSSLITGKENIFEELYPGSYYIIEKSNQSGYVLDKARHSFTITKNNLDVNVLIKNKYQDAIIEFDKYEEHFKIEENEPIFSYDLEEGISFGLYANQTIWSEKTNALLFEKDDIIWKGISDKNGHVIIDIDLPYGSYYIQEITAKEGYFRNQEKYVISFSLEGEELLRTFKIENIYNQLKKADFKLKKYSNSSNQPMKGVIFSFYDEEGQFLFTKATNEEGMISLLFPLRKFFLKEEVTFDDYILDEQTYLLNFLELKEITLQLFNHEKPKEENPVTPPNKEEEKKPEEDSKENVSKDESLEESIGGSLIPVDKKNEVDTILSVPRTDQFSFWLLILLFILLCSFGVFYEKE